MEYEITQEIMSKVSALSLSDAFEAAVTGAAFVVDKEDVEGIAVVNAYKYQLYKYTILAVKMLHLIDIQDNELITEDEYNNLVKSDIIGQLKGCGNGSGRAIARAYKEFCNMFDMEIKNLLAIKNDLKSRIEEAIELNATPELLEQAEQKKEEILKILEKNGGIDE